MFWKKNLNRMASFSLNPLSSHDMNESKFLVILEWLFKGLRDTMEVIILNVFFKWN
jgi:hypothetical protein